MMKVLHCLMFDFVLITMVTCIFFTFVFMFPWKRLFCAMIILLCNLLTFIVFGLYTLKDVLGMHYQANALSLKIFLAVGTNHCWPFVVWSSIRLLCHPTSSRRTHAAIVLFHLPSFWCRCLVPCLIPDTTKYWKNNLHWKKICSYF